MNKENVLKLIKNSGCKNEEEVTAYAAAIKELKLVTKIKNNLVLDMEEIYNVLDFIINNESTEMVETILEIYKQSIKEADIIVKDTTIVYEMLKFKSQWGAIKPYMQLICKGLYIPCNKGVYNLLITALEQLDLYTEVDESFREILKKIKDGNGIAVIEQLEVII